MAYSHYHHPALPPPLTTSISSGSGSSSSLMTMQPQQPSQHSHTHSHHSAPPSAVFATSSTSSATTPTLPASASLSASTSSSAPPNTAVQPTTYKRKRSSKACITCRQKKVKCSGTMPCTHCVEYGEACSFADDTNLSSATGFVGGLHPAATRTMHEMQARIARLEEYITSNGGDLPPLSLTINPDNTAGLSTLIAGTALPVISSTLPSNADTRPLRPMPYATRRSRAAKQDEEGSSNTPFAMDEDSTVGEDNSTQFYSRADSPSTTARNASPFPNTRSVKEEDQLDATSPSHSSQTQQLRPDKKGHLRYLGPASTSAVVAELSDRQRWDLRHSSMRKEKPWSIFSNLGVTVAGALPKIEDVDMPELDLADKLIDAYFQHLSPIFPVLHKTDFVRDYRDVIDNGLDKADPTFLCVLFAVFACGSLVVEHEDERVNKEGGYSAADEPDCNGDYKFGLAKGLKSQGVTRPGNRFYAQTNILILHALAQPSVEQAVLYGLLAFYHTASNAAARAWILCGQALRIGIECGLHRTSASFKPVAREKRRRVFWALYSLEGLLARNLGRPPSIPSDEIDAEYPLDVDLDTLSGPHEHVKRSRALSGFLHMLTLHKLAGEAHRTISKSSRIVGSITEEELRNEILGYETRLRKWFSEMPARLMKPPDALTETERMQRLIMTALYPSMHLLLFLPLLPQRAAPPNELQIYALSRVIMASKDLIAIAQPVSECVPPSHYMFDFTQHLLVAGALLLLLCYRGLEDKTVVANTLSEVDRCVEGLNHIEKVFVGGKAGLEMLIAMRDNMTRAVDSKNNSNGAHPRSQPSLGQPNFDGRSPFQPLQRAGTGQASVPSPQASATSSTSSHASLPSGYVSSYVPQQGTYVDMYPSPSNLGQVDNQIFVDNGTMPQDPSFEHHSSNNHHNPFGWPTDTLNFNFTGLDELASGTASNFYPNALDGQAIPATLITPQLPPDLPPNQDATQSMQQAMNMRAGRSSTGAEFLPYGARPIVGSDAAPYWNPHASQM